MKSEPLLSILVATRNRQYYALELITDILSWATDNIELVVEDNSDNSTLAENMASHKHDSRLKYRHNPAAISSIDNFNNVIEASSGRYICLIGDDDGIHSNVIHAIEWADKEGIDCLVGSVAHEYLWPSASSTHSGTLSFPDFSGALKHRRGKSNLTPLLSRGGTQYLELGLPRLYHGFVRRSVLSAIKEARGYYLGGLSPDIYAAVCLSQLTNITVSIDYPLTIPGVCQASTTAIEGKGASFSTDVRKAPHFRSREFYQFSEKLPPFYCVDTIWADSAIAALTDLGMASLCDQLDVFALSGYISRNNPGLRRHLLDWLVKSGHSKSHLSAIARVVQGYLNHPIRSEANRMLRKVVRLLGPTKMHKIVRLESIAKARLAIEDSTLELHSVHSMWGLK